MGSEHYPQHKGEIREYLLLVRSPFGTPWTCTWEAYDATRQDHLGWSSLYPEEVDNLTGSEGEYPGIPHVREVTLSASEPSAHLEPPSVPLPLYTPFRGL